jgi:hypothetical protein
MKLLSKVNNWLGRKLGEKPIILSRQRVNSDFEFVVVDARRDKYKKFICVCSPDLPCSCVSVVPLKKWRGLFLQKINT